VDGDLFCVTRINQIVLEKKPAIEFISHKDVVVLTKVFETELALFRYWDSLKMKLDVQRID